MNTSNNSNIWCNISSRSCLWPQDSRPWPSKGWTSHKGIASQLSRAWSLLTRNVPTKNYPDIGNCKVYLFAEFGQNKPTMHLILWYFIFFFRDVADSFYKLGWLTYHWITSQHNTTWRSGISKWAERKLFFILRIDISFNDPSDDLLPYARIAFIYKLIHRLNSESSFDPQYWYNLTV